MVFLFLKKKFSVIFKKNSRRKGSYFHINALEIIIIGCISGHLHCVQYQNIGIVFYGILF